MTGERQRKETGETEHRDDDNERDNNNDMLADFVNKRKHRRLNYLITQSQNIKSEAERPFENIKISPAVVKATLSLLQS